MPPFDDIPDNGNPTTDPTNTPNPTPIVPPPNSGTWTGVCGTGSIPAGSTCNNSFTLKPWPAPSGPYTGPEITIAQDSNGDGTPGYTYGGAYSVEPGQYNIFPNTDVTVPPNGAIVCIGWKDVDGDIDWTCGTVQNGLLTNTTCCTQKNTGTSPQE